MLSGPKSPLTKSLPELPVRLSESLPPITPSFPGPPSRFLSPPRGRCSLPPRTQSLPSPPSRLSLPARLKRTSLPPLPRRLSAPLVPFKVSGPLVPILFIARATPLATTSVAAIIVNRRITRCILHSFARLLFFDPEFSRRHGSGRSRRAHTDHSLPLSFSVSY